MLNIVIPMAGHGSRFQKAGYTLPKPLIPVHGRPMIEVVISNLRPRCPHRFIFICLQEHLDRYGLAGRLAAWAPGCAVLTTDGVTEGAACTVLLAAALIDNDTPLMIAISDQWVDVVIDHYLAEFETRALDGLIMTMRADDPKWSFVKLDDDGLAREVVEKQVVSNEATVGIYNYRSGHDFCVAARAMIAGGARVNNEFYVAPAYNDMIATGARVGVYNVGAVGAGMHGLGTPEDLAAFTRAPDSLRLSARGR